MKNKILLRTVDKFYKRASLLSDLSHRIMYGLLPPEETGKQTFNFVAARWAVVGIPDVVYYSTKTIVRECMHYKIEANATKTFILKNGIRVLQSNKLKPSNFQFYKTLVDACVELFADKKGWDLGFGGEAWYNIAQTTFDLINNYEDLLTVEKYSNEEKALLNDAIKNLNIFDGLVHNTASVYGKMTETESSETGTNWNAAADKFKAIMELKNISEEKDPVLVYKAIEKYLYPKNVYKDRISEFIRNPEYKKIQPSDIEERSSIIWKRKEQKSYIKAAITDLSDNINVISKCLASMSDEVLTDIQEQFTTANSLKYSIVRITSDVRGSCIMTCDNVEYFYANTLHEITKTNSTLRSLVSRHVWSIVHKIILKKQTVSNLFKTTHSQTNSIFETIPPGASDEVILQAANPLFINIRLLRKEAEELVVILKDLLANVKIIHDSI